LAFALGGTRVETNANRTEQQQMESPGFQAEKPLDKYAEEKTDPLPLDQRFDLRPETPRSGLKPDYLAKVATGFEPRKRSPDK
jgi:hypothetical protein